MKSIESSRDQFWIRLYWLTRAGMTFLWLWTAFVSWFVFPQDESLNLLRQIGINQFELQVFIGACVLDALMGIVSALRPSRTLWAAQILLVAGYSAAIAIWLPSFLYEPFGPVTKNFAVIACLAYLYGMEEPAGWHRYRFVNGIRVTRRALKCRLG